jgi:serine/threonine-protein kinase
VNDQSGEAGKSTLPESIGRFRLLREIGRGGQGIVYQALDPREGRTVALKALIPQSAPGSPETLRSTKAYVLAARLNASLPRHPNIVSVYEADETDGRAWFAMEYVEGRPVSEWQRRAGIDLRKKVALVHTVALALEQAHVVGFLHCNIKPTNVIVDSEDRPHVTDFRPESTLKKGGGSSTSVGLGRGVLTYLSPEQLLNQKAITRRSDVYALGVLLFEAITGRLPFKAESTVKTLVQVINDPPPRPSTFMVTEEASRVRDFLDAVALRALSKDSAERYQTAQALADELAKWLQ